MSIAIIGGGASGLIAGIVALRGGARVSIYEKNAKLGKKILATGNGRCNITNKNINIKNFHGTNQEFAKHALKEFDLAKCKKFFEEIGLYFTSEENKFFPSSLQASSVVEALEFEFKSLGGVVRLNSNIIKIEKKDKFYFNDEKDSYTADKVLLATGSCAMLGDKNVHDCYSLAKNLNHKITPLYPSLVQLVCKENAVIASGVKFKALISLYINKKQISQVKKDVLITKYGISGSGVLDISREVSMALNKNKDIKVHIDSIPNMSKEKIEKLLHQILKINQNKPICMCLNGFINKKLALYILKICGISGDLKAKNINNKHIKAIIYTIKNLTFIPKDTKGFGSAEVVSGGVDTTQIEHKTMQSKLIKNLYFSGELIDIDGDCGGYNLHWAWASGYVSGKSMLK